MEITPATVPVHLTTEQLSIVIDALGDWVQSEQELAFDDAEFYDAEYVATAATYLLSGTVRRRWPA